MLIKLAAPLVGAALKTGLKLFGSSAARATTALSRPAMTFAPKVLSPMGAGASGALAGGAKAVTGSRVMSFAAPKVAPIVQNAVPKIAPIVQNAVPKSPGLLGFGSMRHLGQLGEQMGAPKLAVTGAIIGGGVLQDKAKTGIQTGFKSLIGANPAVPIPPIQM